MRVFFKVLLSVVMMGLLSSCWSGWREFINSNASDQSSIITDMRILGIKNTPSPEYYFAPQHVMTPSRTAFIEAVDWRTDDDATYAIDLETWVAEPRGGQIQATLRWCIQDHIEGQLGDIYEVEFDEYEGDELPGAAPLPDEAVDPGFVTISEDYYYYSYREDERPRDSKRVADCIAKTEAALNTLGPNLQQVLQSRDFDWDFDAESFQKLELASFDLSAEDIEALFTLLDQYSDPYAHVKRLFNGIVLTPVLQVKRSYLGREESEHAFLDITLRPDWFSPQSDPDFERWRADFETWVNGECSCGDYLSCRQIALRDNSLQSLGRYEELSGVARCYAESSWEWEGLDAVVEEEGLEETLEEFIEALKAEKEAVGQSQHPQNQVVFMQLDGERLATSDSEIRRIIGDLQYGIGEGVEELLPLLEQAADEEEVSMRGRSVVVGANLNFDPDFGVREYNEAPLSFYARRLTTLDGEIGLHVAEFREYIEQSTRYFLISEQFGLFIVESLFSETGEPGRDFYSNIISYSPFVSIEPLFPDSPLEPEEMTLIVVHSRRGGGIDIQTNLIKYTPDS